MAYMDFGELVPFERQGVIAQQSLAYGGSENQDPVAVRRLGIWGKVGQDLVEGPPETERGLLWRMRMSCFTEGCKQFLGHG